MDGHEYTPETAILFVAASLFIGTLSRQLLSRCGIPYTVVLLVIGIGLGVLDHEFHGLGSLSQSIRLWSKIHPNLILYVFLPALLFESSFSMEIHQIKRCLAQMVLLAGPGVFISTICLGLVHRYVFPYGWSWSVSLLLGGLLSATDPVAVVALLKDLGASKKLNTIIDGEALMNDGTAMVVFELFHEMALGKHFSAGEVVLFLSKISLSAVALGLSLGFLSVVWLGYIYNDTVMEITLTLATSYFAFFIAQHVAKVSGVLAVMTVGMFLAAFAKTAFRGESQHAMHYFWNMVAYLANTVIFILSGVVISENFLESQSLIEARDWGYLLLLYLFLQLSRAVVVLVLYPGLRYSGYGLSLKEAAVLIWAGLRGAVALALSLSVDAKGGVSKATQAKFVFFTGGVVFLTLIINGSTTQFLLRYLRIEKATEAKLLVLEHVTQEMNKTAAEAFEELGEDEELGPADFGTVQKYISCLNRFQSQEQQHAQLQSPGASPPEEASRMNQLQDTRLRFLNGVQAAYWQMLEEGRITETAAMLLMQSVDEALDRVERCMSDWSGLRSHIHIPSYLKLLQTRRLRLPQKLLTSLVVARLELGCYISAAFLRAHVHVRRHLREFIGETEIAEAVIKESEEESSEAKQFLEEIRLTFSQVLRVVKTKQVVHAILLRLLNYIKSLESSGLLEEKETIPLNYAIQLELKKLLRKPPAVTIPKASELLVDQPFITGLPNHIRARLVACARVSLKLKGNALYTEGSRAEGFWLIASGVVKWRNQGSPERHLLHPTFAHGSTLGLYEVLMGRPYLCDMVADSVVQCFFLEGSKLLSILRTESGLEQYCWLESTLAVSKLTLPETFESPPMHELRLLIQNSSTTVSCIQGEVIELLPGETGLLLDGFIKSDSSSEIIAPPAAVIHPSQASNPPRSSTTISFIFVFTKLWFVLGVNSPEVHYGSILNIEARSRLVIFRLGSRPSSMSSSMSLLRASLRDIYKTNEHRRRHLSTYESMKLQQSSKRGSWPEQQQNPSKTTQVQLGSMPDLGLALGLPPRPRPLATRRARKQEDSSDDDLDEHIVEIKSPSSLFQSSFNSLNAS